MLTFLCSFLGIPPKQRLAADVMYQRRASPCWASILPSRRKANPANRSVGCHSLSTNM
jgi:hypothetical protein